MCITEHKMHISDIHWVHKRLILQLLLGVFFRTPVTSICTPTEVSKIPNYP